jgi:hypothetical protein
MQHLNFSGLSAIGIEPLTGEACAYSMRVLCDLNEDGCKLIADFFGLRLPYRPMPLDHRATETEIAAYKKAMDKFEAERAAMFHPQCNSSVDGKPAVASVMLSREVMPALARFALFKAGYQYVAGPEDHVAYVAFNRTEGEGQHYLEMLLDGSASAIQSGHTRVYRNMAGAGGQPHVGSRNVHAFTGRVE